MKEADDPWWWLQYHGDFSDHVTGIVVCQFGLRVFLREFAFLNLMTCIMIVLWLSWLICLFACFKNCIKCYFSCKYNEYSCGFLLENFFFELLTWVVLKHPTPLNALIFIGSMWLSKTSTTYFLMQDNNGK